MDEEFARDEETDGDYHLQFENKNSNISWLLGCWVVASLLNYYWYRISYKFALRPPGKKLEGYGITRNYCFPQ